MLELWLGLGLGLKFNSQSYLLLCPGKLGANVGQPPSAGQGVSLEYLRIYHYCHFIGILIIFVCLTRQPITSSDCVVICGSSHLHELLIARLILICLLVGPDPGWSKGHPNPWWTPEPIYHHYRERLIRILNHTVTWLWHVGSLGKY